MVNRRNFKNKAILLLIGLLLFGRATDAANQSIKDSLFHIVHGNYQYQEKADAHFALAEYYLSSDLAQTEIHAIHSQELSRKNGYAKGLARVNYFIVDNDISGLGVDSLLALLLEANIGYEAAKMYIEQALTFNQLGILYERQGKIKLAIINYYKALFIYQKIGHESGVAKEKNNIGLIYQGLKKYHQAKYFFNQSIEIGNKLRSHTILADAYSNLGICYLEEKKANQALHYFELAFKYDKQGNNPGNVATSYNNLGVGHLQLGHLNMAKDLFLKSMLVKKEIQHFTGLANTYNNLAEVYHKANQDDSSLYYINLAIKDARASSSFLDLMESFRIHAIILEKKKDFLGALRYQSMAHELADSLMKAENNILLTQSEKEFSSMTKELIEIKETSDKEKSSLKTGVIILIILLASTLLGFMVYYVFRVRSAYKHLQIKQRKIEVQNKILQVKNIEVIQAKEAAEEAANVKSQFISTISHEIRTPLNAIIGVTNLLQQGEPKMEQVDNLNILKISSENLLQLVNNILDFSKLEAGKLQLENIDFNLRGLVYDVKELFSIKALEKGLELLINFDDKIPVVLKGDPLRINQLLINLVNNAIKFTESGYVRIDVSIQLTTLNHALVHFAVSDTGIGIPVSKQSQIFQSFMQADSNTTRKFGGTGLGLSICKRILENMNSKLQLESVVGKGSKFTFNINFEISRNSSIGKSSRTASFEDSIHGKKVLVVEDNMMNIMVIRQFLQKWGVITEIALNGREGYNRVLETNFDAILMDIHMPDMDGIEATILIRKLTDERKRNVPIIALTAENEMQFRQKVYEVGMNDYIFKPFNPDDLKERLGYALYNSGINKYQTR